MISLLWPIEEALTFEADYLTYRRLTVEFLSTLEVIRRHNTPKELNFPLGNLQRTLSVNELNTIINGVEGCYLVDYDVDANSIWDNLAL